ncbi:MAG: tetratricopeptide repeat protein [Myxococcales bacterium]|nr:tetratricopeptide repeat protein [Myxococcales bacterium]
MSKKLKKRKGTLLQGRSLGLSQKIKRLQALCAEEAWGEADEMARALFEQFPQSREVVQCIVEIAHATDNYLRFSKFLYRLWHLTPKPDANLIQAYMMCCLERGSALLAYQLFQQSLEKGITLEGHVFEMLEPLRVLHQAAWEELGDFSIDESVRDEVLLLNDEAELCLSLELYEEAQAFLEKASSKVPSFLRLRNHLAQVSLMRGHFAQAQDLLEKSLQQAPDDVHALFLQAWIWRLLGKDEDARALLPRLVAAPLQGRKELHAHKLLWGLACLQADKEIETCFGTFGEELAEDPVGTYFMGVAYAHLGDEKAARIFLEKAASYYDTPSGMKAEVALKTLDLPPSQRMPLSYFAAEEWLPWSMRLDGLAAMREDVEDLDAYLAENPSFEILFPSLTKELGEEGSVIAFIWGDFFERRDWLDSVFEFAKSSKGTDRTRHFLFHRLSLNGYLPNGARVMMWKDGKQVERRCVGFSVSADAKPQDISPQAHKLLLRGIELTNAQKYKKAEEVLRQAYELEPNNPSIAGNLSTVLDVLEHKEEAVAIFDRLMADQPDYFFGRCRRALEAIERRDHEDAERWLEPLWEQKDLHISEMSMFLFVYCSLDALLGRWEAVREWLEIWEEIAPEDPKLEHWYMRLVEEDQMPRGEEGKPWLRKALKGLGHAQ